MSHCPRVAGFIARRIPSWQHYSDVPAAVVPKEEVLPLTADWPNKPVLWLVDPDVVANGFDVEPDDDDAPPNIPPPILWLIISSI